MFATTLTVTVFTDKPLKQDEAEAFAMAIDAQCQPINDTINNALEANGIERDFDSLPRTAKPPAITQTVSREVEPLDLCHCLNTNQKRNLSRPQA